MKFQLNILVVILRCHTIFAFLTERLKLSAPLSHFKDCTITILTARIQGTPEKPKKKLDFYDIEPLVNLPTVRFLQIYQYRTRREKISCDGNSNYLPDGSPIIKSERDTVYPFSKWGCNVLVYISPPQCQHIWDFHRSFIWNSFATGLTQPALEQTLKGFQYNLNDRGNDPTKIISTNFAQFLIIIQKATMNLPVGIMRTVDFDMGTYTLRQEYQAQKLIFQLSWSHFKPRDIEVSSIVRISTWSFEIFKNYIKKNCKSRFLDTLQTTCFIKSFEKFTCSDKSSLCQFHYDTYKTIEQALRKQPTRNLQSSWLIFKSSLDKDFQIDRDDKTSIFPQPDGNKMYLTEWKSKHSIDILLLSLVSPNSTMYIGDKLIGKTTLGYIPPIPIMDIFVSSESFNGFRRDDKGLYYVTCVWGLGNKWFVSLYGFISIFDSASWIFVAILGVWSGLICVSAIENGIKSFSDFIWYGMFGLVIFLEQGFTVPKGFRLPKSVFQLNYVTPVYASWILAGVVISNCYRGSNIDKLISPIPEKRFETFDQIIERNFTIYAEYRMIELPEFLMKAPWKTKLKHSYQLLDYIDIFNKDIKMKRFVANKYYQNERYYGYSNPPEKYMKVINMFLNHLKMPETLGDVIDSVCGKKTQN